MGARRPGPRTPVDVFERGDIYFLLQPRVDTPQAKRRHQVQRAFMLMKPNRSARFRRVLLTHKRLPSNADGRRERFWCFVDRFGPLDDVLGGLEPHHYETQTQGERFQPGAKLVAVGRYALARHNDQTHLAFELDAHAGDDARDLIAVPERGRFLLLAMRPHLGQRGAREWDALPEELKAPFEGEKRFASAVPPLLAREGMNLVLVPVKRAPHLPLGPPRPVQEELPTPWVATAPTVVEEQLSLPIGG